jgi:nucleotide-binding universal stress UspA family protein
MYRILVPVDGSAAALAGARQATKLAAARSDATVYLVNAQPMLNRHIAQFASRRAIRAARIERGQAALKAARELVEAAGVPVRTAVLRGERASAIARFAADERVDRVVLGTSRKGALLRFLSGSLTDRLLEKLDVPVEVVAGPAPGALQRWGIPAGVGVGLAALLLAAE